MTAFNFGIQPVSIGIPDKRSYLRLADPSNNVCCKPTMITPRHSPFKHRFETFVGKKVPRSKGSRIEIVEFYHLWDSESHTYWVSQKKCPLVIREPFSLTEIFFDLPCMFSSKLKIRCFKMFGRLLSFMLIA